MNKRIVQYMAIGLSSLALMSCGSFSARDDGSIAEVQESADIGDGIGGAVSMSPLDDPNSPLSNRVIYFDFDRSDIKPAYRETIEAHSRYLSDNPDIRIELAGHCDERGTPEYNLALGERRAKAVAQSMRVLGVPYNQLDTNSFGEEDPVDLGHNEVAWQQNRRVELIYPAQ